jgi:hypothetical protein
MVNDYVRFVVSNHFGTSRHHWNTSDQKLRYLRRKLAPFHDEIGDVMPDETGTNVVF